MAALRRAIERERACLSEVRQAAAAQRADAQRVAADLQQQVRRLLWLLWVESVVVVKFLEILKAWLLCCFGHAVVVTLLKEWVYMSAHQCMQVDRVSAVLQQRVAVGRELERALAAGTQRLSKGLPSHRNGCT